MSAGEVFDKISKRLVPFEMVAKVFKDMTSEGGKFYNMQEVQAETLRGKISNLKDAYEVMLNEIGKGQAENLKGAVDWARRLMQNYEDTGRVLVELITTYGVYKATLIGLEVATNTFAAANHKLITTLVNAGKYLAKNPFMIVAAGITAAGYAIYRNHKELEGYQKIQQQIARTQSDYTKEISKEISKLDALYAKLKLAKKGTKEYNEAKKDIYTQYSGYIAELKAEGVEVGNLAGIYDNLKTKIEDATKARTSSKAKQKLTETYDQEIDSYYDRYIEIITKARNQLNRGAKLAGGEYKEFSEFEKAGFWKFVSGSMNINDLERTNGLERVVNVLNNAALDASGDLKLLRLEMQATTAQYNKSLREIKMAYGEIEDVGGGNVPPGIDGSAVDEAVASIKKEIETLKVLKKEYEDWKQLGAKDADIAFSLQGYFPNIKTEYGEDFITQLNFATRILEKIQELEKIAPDEAYNLKMSFGLEKSNIDKQILNDKEKAYKESAKAAEEYFNTLRKWETEDFKLEGKGISFDISKIVSDLNEKIAEIRLRATKAKELFGKIDIDSEVEVGKVKEIFVKEFGEDAWTEFWNSYTSKGFSAIQNLADSQEAYEKKIAQDKIDNLADEYVKRQTSNLNLSDWGDKSISQVLKIKEEFEKINDAKITLPEDLQKKLNDANINIDEFTKSVKEAFSKIGENIDDETFKKITKLGGVAAQQILDISSALGELASATGDLAASNISTAIGEIGDVFSSTMQGFAAGGVAGAIIAGYGVITSKLTEAAAEAEVLRHELAMTAIEFEKSLQSIEDNRKLDVFSGIFGEADFYKFKSNLDIAADSVSNLTDLYKGLEEQTKANKKAAEEKIHVEGDTITFGETEWEDATKLLSDMRTKWQKLFDSDDNQFVFDLSSLFDTDGKPIEDKFKELLAWYEAYGDGLTATSQETVTKLIAEWERYEQAMSDTESYVSSIFDILGSNITDSMVNSFLQIGDSAAGLETVFEDLGGSIAKSLLRSFIIDNVLNKYQDEMNKILDDSEGFTDESMWDRLSLVFGEIRQEIEEISPEVNKLLSDIQGMGLLGQGESNQNTLGEGIKGITEDTASLLSSFLNAIRSDVTLMRSIQATHLPIISSSLPTIMGHLAQVEANTFDIAQSNIQISDNILKMLETLQSVMVYEDGAAIRTYS